MIQFVLFLFFFDTVLVEGNISIISWGHLEVCDCIFGFVIISDGNRNENFKCFIFAISKLNIFNLPKFSPSLSFQNLFAVLIQMHEMLILLLSLYSKKYFKVVVGLHISPGSQLFKWVKSCIQTTRQVQFNAETKDSGVVWKSKSTCPKDHNVLCTDALSPL